MAGVRPGMAPHGTGTAGTARRGHGHGTGVGVHRGDGDPPGDGGRLGGGEAECLSVLTIRVIRGQ